MFNVTQKFLAGLFLLFFIPNAFAAVCSSTNSASSGQSITNLPGYNDSAADGFSGTSLTPDGAVLVSSAANNGLPQKRFEIEILSPGSSIEYPIEVDFQFRLRNENAGDGDTVFWITDHQKMNGILLGDNATYTGTTGDWNPGSQNTSFSISGVATGDGFVQTTYRDFRVKMTILADGSTIMQTIISETDGTHLYTSPVVTGSNMIDASEGIWFAHTTHFNDPSTQNYLITSFVSVVSIKPCDYGDLNKSYGIAVHDAEATPSVYLGSVAPDLESQTLNAEHGFSDGGGDDANASDDEDGITIPALHPRLTTTIKADVVGAGGYLNAWIDFDGNGTFEASEQVATDIQDGGALDVGANTGEIEFSITVPGSAPLGQTYARFRWSSDSGLGVAGEAADGEVEDYTIAITSVPTTPGTGSSCSGGVPLTFANFSSAELNMTGELQAGGVKVADVVVSVPGYGPYAKTLVRDGGSRLSFQSYSSAPSPTKLANGYYTIAITPVAGASIDPGAFQITGKSMDAGTELSGYNNYQDFSLDGDDAHLASIVVIQDTTDKDYLDHVDVGDGLIPGGVYSSSAGNKYYADAPAFVLQANTNTVAAGETLLLEFQKYDAKTNQSTLDYENHDLLSAVSGCPPGEDYSDAAADGSTAPDGTSTTAYGEAKHIIVSGIQLGAAIDAESASISSADASGDGADDDGVSTFPTLTEGDTGYTIPAGNISATGSGNLHAWIDFDGNGSFDANEFASTTVSNGTLAGDLEFSGFGSTMSSGTTFVRLRLTSALLTSSDAAGTAPDGEVEDYALVVAVPGYPVSGRVYEDRNGDGINDAAEAGIAEVVVVLSGTTGDGDAVCISSRTDGNGEYRFPQVLPGSYVLYEAANSAVPVPAECAVTNALDPSGYVSTTANALPTFSVVDTAVQGKDFGDIGLPTFQPDHVGTIYPGSSISYAHRFQAQSNGTLSFSSVNTTPLTTGWTNALYQDSDCNGLLEGSEESNPLTGSLSVTAGVDICLINKVSAPANAPDMERWENEIQADFATGNPLAGSISLSVTDLSTTSSAGPAGHSRLELRKSVENLSGGAGESETQTQNQAKPGDVLKYRIYYSNTGDAPLSELVVNDSVPEYTLLQGTPICEEPLPAGLSDCQATLGGKSIQWVFPPADKLAAGEGGVVSYEVRIE